MNITISHLSKSFLVHKERRRLFEDLSFSAEVNPVLAVLGPSGSGKTTLLRILAGLEEPEEGEVSIDGRPLRFERKALHQYRQSLGVVFQQHNLFPHYTVIENIMLPLTLVHGEAEAVAGKKAKIMMERLQLSHHQHKKPYQLSGGESQRVAIARALITEPRFLLFDEPTASLDVEMKVEVLDLIAELRKLQTPIVLVTHEIGFARKCADHILFMAKGTVVEQGPASSFFSNPTTEQAKKFLATVFAY